MGLSENRVIIPQNGSLEVDMTEFLNHQISGYLSILDSLVAEHMLWRWSKWVDITMGYPNPDG